jgi:uncharacterized protein YjdB
MSAEDTNATSEPTDSVRITPPPPPSPERLTLASREPEKLVGPKHIWYAAYIQDQGWQLPVRGPRAAGTTGQSLRMEALAIMVSGTPEIRASAHVQRLGWLAEVPVREDEFIVVGKPGQSLRMEALRLRFDDGRICAIAHVQHSGWQEWFCSPPTGGTVEVGTTGKSLRMEAIALEIS